MTPGQACSCGQGACDFLGCLALQYSKAPLIFHFLLVKCGDFILLAGFCLVEVAILMAGATLEASLESGGKTLEDMETYLQSNTSCHVRHVMYPSFDENLALQASAEKCVSFRNEVVNGQLLFVILADSGSLQVGDEAENAIFAEFVAGRSRVPMLFKGHRYGGNVNSASRDRGCWHVESLK